MKNISIEKYKEVATKEERMLRRLIDEFVLNNSKFLIIEGPAGSGKTESQPPKKHHRDSSSCVHAWANPEQCLRDFG